MDDHHQHIAKVAERLYDLMSLAGGITSFSVTSAWDKRTVSGQIIVIALSDEGNRHEIVQRIYAQHNLAVDPKDRADSMICEILGSIKKNRRVDSDAT